MTQIEEKKIDFQNLRVISFESRLADIMRESLRRKGAQAQVAPSMQEIPLDKNPEAFAFAEKLLAGHIDVLICMTGVGMKMLIKTLSSRYEEKKILEALGKITLVARGPKPTKVLKEYQLNIAMQVPEPNTWREIIETLEYDKRGLEFEGKKIAIQEYGVSNQQLVNELKKRGANVIEVPVYRWAMPDNTEPLERAITDIVNEKADCVLFTSAQQVRHLFKMAGQKGVQKELQRALKKNTLIASIGPTTTEVLIEYGLGADFEPSHPKMGHLVSELSKAANELLHEKRHPRSFLSWIESRPKELQNQKAQKDAVFLKACRGEETPYTPVWLMRQAGRYMKEYRKVRDKVSFLDLCKNKELVAEVTITAAEKIKADAAIIFSDILVIVEPLGLGLDYLKSEGPSITGNVHSYQDIDRLSEIEPEESLNYVFDGIRLTRSHLNSKTPLIGFSGAPFTLASYIIEGGGSKVFANTKKLMYSDKAAWDALMSKITRGLIKYLKGQVRAGADALQIFDSWVGCLGPEDYREFVLPHTQALIDAVKGEVPIIHFGTGTASFLKSIQEAGGDVIGVDYKIELDQAWKILGHETPVQGNLDPLVLYSSKEVIRKRVERILKQAGGRAGHIFNLGHGILPKTPVENVIYLIECVHELSAR